ncbi:MAG: lysozyme [Hyphomonadaceae bacterium]
MRALRAGRGIIAAILAALALAACGDTGGDATAVRTFPKLADKITAGALLEPAISSRTDEVPLRSVSPAGLKALQQYEGQVLCEPATEDNWHCPYDDSSDYCTIGHGHLIAKASCALLIDELTESGFLDGISEAEADEILRHDLASSQLSLERQMEAASDTLGKVGLTETQYDALVSFIFNVGGGNFTNSTLLRVLKEREALEDSAEVARQFTRWTKSAGKHVPGLLVRRNNEVDQFFAGFERPATARGADESDSVDIRVGEAVIYQ